MIPALFNELAELLTQPLECLTLAERERLRELLTMQSAERERENATRNPWEPAANVNK